MSITNKIDVNTRDLKRKLSDTYLHHISTDLEIIRVELVETDYNGTDVNIHDIRPVQGYIDFPSNDIPLTFGATNQSRQGVHMFDLLPIEAYFKFEDDIKIGDIVLMKINVSKNNNRLIMLQTVDLVSKGMLSVTWKRYTVAPPTITVKEYPELVAYLDSYMAE